MSLNELIVVIPAYEPNKLMLDLIEKLNQYFEECKILIVNDGSQNADHIFAKAKEVSNVIVVNHDVNKGKGAALKTAYQYIENMDDNHHIIVTADADGQHRPEDIFKVASYYDEIKDGVVLGSRQFENEVPFRSRFGNDTTRFLYRLFNNRIITDNQTGLRAFGSELLPFMTSIKCNRYEYEMNVLSECARQNVSISEVKIATVYINNNESSHFRPFKDFNRICRNMFKYILPTIITFILNIAIFVGMIYMLKNTSIETKYSVLISAITSCCVSGMFNMIMHYFGLFYGNKYLLKLKAKRRKYLTLGLLSIVASSLTVFGLFFLVDNAFGAKGISEGALIIITMLANYFLVPKAKLK